MHCVDNLPLRRRAHLDPYTRSTPPPPPFRPYAAAAQALLFDSHYDHYRGVVSMVQMRGGAMRKGDRVTFAASQLHYDVVEVGVLHPDRQETTELSAGQVRLMSDQRALMYFVLVGCLSSERGSRAVAGGTL
jgi:translation elongation factor EF-4